MGGFAVVLRVLAIERNMTTLRQGSGPTYLRPRTAPGVEVTLTRPGEHQRPRQGWGVHTQGAGGVGRGHSTRASGTTATGQVACSVTAIATEPNSIRLTVSLWWAPTTIRFIRSPIKTSSS